MKKLASNLQPNSSVLFVLVRKATPDKVVDEIKPFGGTVLQTSLSHEDEAEAAGGVGRNETSQLLNEGASLLNRSKVSRGGGGGRLIRDGWSRAALRCSGG